MGQGQMWPLFTTTTVYAMNTFASEALSRFSPFQLVFLRDPPGLTSLSFPKIDTILVKHKRILQFIISKSTIYWQTIIGMENQAGVRI